MRGIIRTLRAGTSNKGFTIIELVLVIFIIGLVLAMIFPRLPGLDGGSLRQSSRHFIRTVQVVMNRATSTKRLYRLNYDLENEQYWATVLGPEGEFVPIDATVSRRTRLREPIDLQDVITVRQGRVIEGEAYTQFYPSGLVERTHLHFTDGDEKTITLIIQSLTGRVKILDGYVEEQRL